MTLNQLLASLREREVQVWKEGDHLRYRVDAEGLTPELLGQLRDHKAAILEFLQKANALGQQQPSLRAAPRRENLPLSFGQERLWLLDQIEPDSAVYNIPMGLRLGGVLNVPVLQRCLSEILRRQQSLRTRFEKVEGQPIQVIQTATLMEIPLVDLRGLPDPERGAKAYRLCLEETQRPFDLRHDLLLRARLFRLSETDHILLLTVHHIASDGWSMGLLVHELRILYEAFVEGNPSPLPELEVQYADFAVWQRECLQGEVLERQLSYWRKALQGAPMLLDLPTDRPRPVKQSYRGALMPWELSKPLSVALEELSRREGATLFMTFLAAFQTLLHRYTGSDDILVGSPIAGRNRTEIEPLIGFFVNMLVLRGDLSGNPSFRDLLGRTRETALGAYAHQDLPFEKLVEELHPERDLSRSPLVQVMFALQNAPWEAAQLARLEVTPVQFDSETSKFDLTLFVRERGASLQVVVEYNTDLFEAESTRRMLGHYQRLLEGIVLNPDQRLSDLPLLTSAERHQLLVEWNQTQQDYPRNKCIHELFEEQVERMPEAIAVVFEDTRLTYRQLNERANQLAHRLQELGVGPETLVGICVERSLEMVVGLLGILKAGGAYVPLDPAYPKDRLAFMLEDARPLALVTQRKLQEVLPSHQARVVCLDASDETSTDVKGQSADALESRSNCLAYVLYTSGSTGRPKGVAIEHRSAVALAAWARRVFTDEEFAGVLFSTSICFDLSVFELFVTLGNGGEVILAQNALELPMLPAANKVRMINTVPSAIAELVRTNGIPRSVITVNLAGEPLAQPLVDKLYEDCLVPRVYDLYGPTETTTYSTFSLRLRGGKATIGRPISNTHIYILDQHLQPVPIMVPGELYIGGDGLARCYLKRPELTTERFVCNPFIQESGSRLYKTGDLARYLPNGTIEYLGRLDHQVKIRGFRIELGEIDSAVMGHPGVREAVTVMREDIPGDKQLVVYLTSNSVESPKISELRGLLQAKLPQYMVPSAFITLDKLPMTPNGKVDRKSLPVPNLGRTNLGSAFAAPRNQTEEVLVRIWCEILRLKQVGVHDNFFEMGGHSLLALQLQARVEKEFGRGLPLAAFFQCPTVAQLQELLTEAPALSQRARVFTARFQGTKSPIFAFHFLFLAQLLAKHTEPGRPVYGIESELSDEIDSIAKGSQRKLSLEALAKSCVDDLRRIQPHGPYNLVGFCFGGNLAFEVASQLILQGERVGLLALLNSYYGPGMSFPAIPLFRHWLYHARQISIHGLPYLAMKLARKLRQRKSRQSKSGTDHIDNQGPWNPEELRLLKTHLARQVISSYRGQPVAVRTVLFRAVADPPVKWKYDSSYGWKNVVLGGLYSEDIFCGHSEIVEEPWIAEVSKRLDKHLSR